MAGIIDTASGIKKAGDPLNPLDAGDFADPHHRPDQTIDPTTGQPMTKPKQVTPTTDAGGALGNVATALYGAIDTANNPGAGQVDPNTQTNPLARNSGDSQTTGTLPSDQGNANPLARTPSASDTASSGNPLARDPSKPIVASSLPATNGQPATSAAPQTGGPLTAAPPGAPSNPGGSSTYNTAQNTPANNGTAWSPTSGIIDQIQGSTPGKVEGQGYTATTMGDTPAASAEGYTAGGYTAAQGTATTSDENVSSAVDRITGKDSELMQRAKAQALDDQNARGTLNSTMAVQAGQAAVLDKAVQIAQGDVQNAQFNAAEKNAMTISNVQQANAAAAFHAQATNDASAFGAAARNQASQFNSGQAQQKMEFAAQQWDAAAAFSAQAKQAADTFNVDAYNKAMQSYVDAKNAATAAQNDAVNLSRRDTAQIGAAIQQAQIGAAGMIGAAQAHAGGMVAAAQIGADASANNLKTSLAAQKEMQGTALAEDMDKYKLGLNQQQTQWASNLSAGQFDTFQSGYTAISTSQLEPDAKQNALQNFMQMWTASGTLPFDIHVPGT